MPLRDERGRFIKPLPARPRDWLPNDEGPGKLMVIGAVLAIATVTASILHFTGWF